MMPFAAIGRQPSLDATQPDIETMCAWDLESEVAVCRYYQDYHKAEAKAIGKLNPSVHTHEAYGWYRRRIRVQELLERKVGVSA
ncbi:hypothetical protein [Geothrix campi]|uniref:hypothetical protein n=1 Tax=Geothrix campi TaxID=2966450 RepID=UPI0021472F95|nr:hypothetical protein [Geothrix sp. SG10]